MNSEAQWSENKGEREKAAEKDRKGEYRATEVFIEHATEVSIQLRQPTLREMNTLGNS